MDCWVFWLNWILIGCLISWLGIRLCWCDSKLRWIFGNWLMCLLIIVVLISSMFELSGELMVMYWFSWVSWVMLLVVLLSVFVIVVGVLFISEKLVCVSWIVCCMVLIWFVMLVSGLIWFVIVDVIGLVRLLSVFSEFNRFLLELVGILLFGVKFIWIFFIFVLGFVFNWFISLRFCYCRIKCLLVKDIWNFFVIFLLVFFFFIS